ncbi:MAG: nucleotidyltransferase domain-containing protein [Chloroflexi bacterium]|nr:nucleotidyltransferase domain-containing protein [Chloroflexota bacterium]
MQTHQLARTALLQRAQAVVMQDARLRAAWLFGSLGRGDADELSDIDLFIIVADEHQDDVVAKRYAYIAQLGEPLLILEAPQNWPPGAVYNMALYPGESGPHQVDWYWQRQSAARIPTEIQLWFDRVNLPHADGPTRFDYAPVPPRLPTEVVTQHVNQFWVMLLIAAKYVARIPPQRKTDLLQWPLGSLHAVAQFVGQPVPLIPEPAPSVTTSADKLLVLREYAAVMETLMPHVVNNGGRIPVAIVPQTYRYLDFIEAITQLQPNPIERL